MTSLAQEMSASIAEILYAAFQQQKGEDSTCLASGTILVLTLLISALPFSVLLVAFTGK